jgi:uncharacterized membrane protein (DUF2068 family)
MPIGSGLWMHKSFVPNERLTMTNPDRKYVKKGTHAVAKRRALQAIAVFEATKGIAALAAIVGVFHLMHHDVRHLAIELIGRFGLNPDARYPSILLHYAALLPNADVHSLVILAFVYMLLRLLEAYGLWNDLAWGEWLGALSGGLYIPFEARHLIHRPSVISGTVLACNVFLVIFLALQLWSKHADATNHQ